MRDSLVVLLFSCPVLIPWSRFNQWWERKRLTKRSRAWIKATAQPPRVRLIERPYDYEREIEASTRRHPARPSRSREESQ